MKKRKKNHLGLWAMVVSVFFLLTAPSGWAITTYEGGGQYEIDTDLNDDVEIKAGTTVNLRAVVSGYIQAHPGSVLNIYSGSVFWYVIVSPGQPEAQVSVYGTDFVVDGIPTSASEFLPVPGVGSVLNGIYGNGQPIEPTWLQPGLWFFSDSAIQLKSPASNNDDDIEIDIKPGSDENIINLKSKGVVPVAAITTEKFYAGSLVPDYSISFAGASPVHSTLCDVDQDGDMDMLFHFRTQSLNLDENSTEATLIAAKKNTKSAVTKSSTAASGDVIKGTDNVKIKSSKKK